MVSDVYQVSESSMQPRVHSLLRVGKSERSSGGSSSVSMGVMRSAQSARSACRSESSAKSAER
eukprot:5636347-Pleurochrysis_carterae.AAC.1